MTTLTEAEAALDAGRQRHTAAQRALSAARAELERVEAAIIAGDTVKPSELGDAKAGIDHALLAVQGAEAPLQALHDAARRAQADLEAEELAVSLRQRGAAVSETLQAVADALEPFAAAVADFDALAVEARRTAGTRLGYGLTDRFRHTGSGPARVEGIAIEKCRGVSQLARVIVPHLQALGAPQYVVDELRQLGAAATSLPGGTS